MTTLVRPKRPARLALVAGVAALGAIVIALVTTGSGEIEPARPAAQAAVDEPALEPDDPSWAMSAPHERLGYRNGRRDRIAVVPLGPTGVEVEVRTARAFLAMRAAARQAGVELRLHSGFRTAEQQRVLFRAWRSGRGNRAARPGLSNHQSGRALDIAVRAPGALAWLEANARSFGFQRTVKGEPWHWEYVDVEIARGATKRTWRKAKGAKVVGHVKRPARRPVASKARVHRVAASSR